MTTCPGSARYRAMSFEVNGKCYMGTGSTGGGISQNLKDLWEYDVALNVWTQMADLTGRPRTNATAATVGNFGYVGLGSDNNSLLTDWWQYDPALNVWTAMANFPGRARFGAAAITLQNRIFTGGGLDSTQTSSLSDFFAYDPVGNVWATKASMPIGVSSPATFTIGTKGYFVGGATNGSVSATTQNAEYDPANNTWTTKAPYAAGNTFSAIGFSLYGYGYMGTGFTGSLTDVMYRYNPVANNWTQETNWPTGIRQWAVCCVSGNRAFVGTGNSTGGLLFSDWWEFIPAVTTSTNQLEEQVNGSVRYDENTKEIIFENKSNNVALNIYSVDGKLVFSKTLIELNEHISWNHQGIYLIALNNNSTTKIYCR